jgi:hypothetical protein
MDLARVQPDVRNGGDWDSGRESISAFINSGSPHEVLSLTASGDPAFPQTGLHRTAVHSQTCPHSRGYVLYGRLE